MNTACNFQVANLVLYIGHWWWRYT